VAQRHGPIDLLIHNAGVGYVGAVADMSAEEVDRIVETNLTALIDLTRLVLPGMLRRGDGDVLVVSSSATRRASGAWTGSWPRCGARWPARASGSTR
jgi:uncharacterized protein